MDRFLLKFAEADLRAAKLMLQGSDDFDIRISAYHIEQAIEKIVKQVLMECGIDYSRNHKFRELLSVLPDTQPYLSVDTLDFLTDNADRLTNWATQLKYVRSYVTTRRETVRMFEFATQLISDVIQAINKTSLGLESRPTPDYEGLKKMSLGE